MSQYPYEHNFQKKSALLAALKMQFLGHYDRPTNQPTDRRGVSDNFYFQKPIFFVFIGQKNM